MRVALEGRSRDFAEESLDAKSATDSCELSWVARVYVGVVNFLANDSDPEFMVWNLRAEKDDGRVQSVKVKVDRLSVAEHQGPVEGSASKWAQLVIQSQGKSLIELTEVQTLPPAYVFGVGGFVPEWD